jgi:hypothetical protein
MKRRREKKEDATSFCHLLRLSIKRQGNPLFFFALGLLLFLLFQAATIPAGKTLNNLLFVSVLRFLQ